jgi:two-component system sensor histidine kinase UhpB
MTYLPPRQLRQSDPARPTNRPLPACAASRDVGESLRMSESGDPQPVAIAPCPAGSGRSWWHRSSCGCLHNDATDAAVREGERRRIAQQIHDDLGGVLTGLKACISVLLDRASRAGLAPEPLLVDASALADLAFKTVREFALNVRPPMADHMNIWTALECRVEQLARRTDIEVDYAVDPLVTLIDLGEARETVVYRVICEALTNIEKHARASSVSVKVSTQGGSLNVIVTDNGVGLSLGAGPGPMTLGIAGMKEQAGAWGADLALTTGSGGGTMVHLTVPLGPDDVI